MRPIHGANSATMSCGTTMQAPMRVDAHSLERIVRMPPISGSIAALASWNSRMQPAKTSSRRLLNAHRASPVVAAAARFLLRTLDVARANAGKRQYGRRRERGGEEEHGLVRDEVSACAHRGGGDAVADGGEAGIAPEPCTQGGMADEREADGGDDRPEHAAGGRMHARGEPMTTEKIGQSASASALRQMATTASVATSRAERMASTSAPPGIWAASATSPPAVRTRPISNCDH